MFRAVACALVLTAGLSAAPVPKSPKSGNELDGTWELSERVESGNKVDLTFTTRWMIDGEDLTVERIAQDGKVMKPPVVPPPVYKLAKAGKDNARGIDFTITYLVDGSRSTFPAVYELDKDTLKFCCENRGNGRPTECKATETTTYYVFKRVKADEKK